MIYLKDVWTDNWYKVIKLSPGKENEKRFPSNRKTLLQALLNDKLENVKAIYHNEELIGLTWFNIKEESIFIVRFMIDENFQGKGYGKKSLEKIIDYLKKNYDKKNIEISTDSEIALKLYKKCGFEEVNDKNSKLFRERYNEILLVYKN